MKKFRMIINVERCEDCNACLVSCKDEHVDNNFPGYSLPQPRHGHKWITITRKERGEGSLLDVFYLPKPCQHCDDAPCVKNSAGAITKRSDGIVLIDSQKAKGNKALVGTCPYGVIHWNEELNTAQKCTMCAHLLDDGWTKPRCVQACPTEALRIVHVEDDEWSALAENEKLEPLNPEFNTKPGALYRNLALFTKAFIAGSVTSLKNGVEDCVEGARVVLSKNSHAIAELETDNYGDFKFDRLPERSGEYKISVNSSHLGSCNLVVDLKESVYLGKVMLS